MEKLKSHLNYLDSMRASFPTMSMRADLMTGRSTLFTRLKQEEEM